MNAQLRFKGGLLLSGLLALALIVSACSGGVPAPAPTAAPAPEQPQEQVPSPSTAGETLTLYVGPNTMPCMGVAPMTCLLVKQNPDEDYSLFYDTIQGFEYEPGFEYELKVLRETRENVPADASRYVWTLVETVGKTPVVSSESFEGTTWKLLAYANESGQFVMAVPDAEATVVFDGGRMSGNGSCNNFSGTYVLDGESLTIQLGPTTMMACPEPVMAQEQAFYTNLAAVASYALVGNQLHLLNANGDVILAFEPLVSTPLTGTLWQAVMYNNGKQAVVGVLDGTEITAIFGEDGTLSGSAGCNNYTTGYTVDGNAMTIGQAASTMMLCPEPEGVMDQEMAYLAALSTTATYSLQGDQLELRTADGALVASYVAVAPQSLSGATWQAVSYNTGTQAVTSVLAGTTITAVFADDGSLSGSAGCNTYTTSYTTDGNAITIQPAATTRKMCVEPEGVMEQEAAYLNALTTAATYSIQGDLLELRTADGALVASFVPQTPSQLVGVDWEVINFNTGEALTGPIAGTTITAIFGADGQLSGNAGCNTYSAGYTVDGSSITIGPAISTMMACAEPEGIMEQESAYLQALSTAASYVVQGDRLDLLTAEGTFVAIYGAQTAAEAPSAEAVALAQTEMANMAYTGTSVFTGTVQLTNGVYTQTVAPDSPMVTSIQLTDFVTVGVLNDQPASAGILVSNSGGSGVFYDLAVATEQDGQWTNAATTFLGDRVTINSLSIADNMVIVDMVTQGPNDPMCCATQQVINSYELQGNELIQVYSETVGTVSATGAVTSTEESGIVGMVWQWVDTTYNNDTQTVVPDPSSYTMALLPDGTVQLQVDCNSGGGTYTLDGSQLTIDVTTLTRVACPEGSLSEEFIQGLNAAATYVMDGADLVVNMAMDAGNLRFQAAGPAEMPAAAVTEPSASGPVTPTVTQPAQSAIDPEMVIGETWKWAGFTDPVNGTQEIADPERYTMQLLPSGTVRIQADCNRGAGKYTYDGSSIDIEVAALTRAVCPPGSLSNDYIKYLNAASVWFMREGDLFFDLFADSGTMRFVK